MTLLALLLGLGLPALAGWTLLRLLEGGSPVLGRSERWLAGGVLGVTLSTFTEFLLLWARLIPLTRTGVLVSSALLLALLSALLFWRRGTLRVPPAPPAPSAPLPPALRILAWILGAWVAAKVATGAFLLTMSPPFQDDVINNWNFRGKVLYFARELTLTMRRGYGIVETGAVSSYPPSLPLLKANLAAIAGGWNEALVNAPHILWYLAALALLFFALRWWLSVGWSLLGAFLLSGIPLYLLHGSTAYADLFVSLHVLIAASALLRSVEEDDPGRRRSLTLIFGLCAGLLTFTKNEGIALYLPVLALCAVAALALQARRGGLGNVLRGWLTATAIAAALLLPWLAYKWTYGLGFGNAKDVSSLALGWQPGVLSAIAKNSFLGGSWLLFFPLIAGSIAYRWRIAFRPPVLLLTLLVLLTYAAQLMIFLFTSLSVEALYQTGYGRGVVQLLPVGCMLITLLLAGKEARQGIE